MSFDSMTDDGSAHVSAHNIKKLGYGIIVFDDVFHLLNMISEIRDMVDEITVCLQNESYYGTPIEHSVVSYIGKLSEKGLVDHVIWFTPKTDHADMGNHAPRFVETDKRNFLLDFLEHACGCSHSIVVDSDEFYCAGDFLEAKNMIDSNPEIKVSYCPYVNYYRDYLHVMVWPFQAYVPFISESRFRFSFLNGSFDKPSDPTRRYEIEEKGVKYAVFNFKVLKMHHLSWIRKDIRKKIDNWSSKKYFESKEGLRDRIIDRYENYKEGQNAIIMFNVPNGEVIVDRLPRQYVKPKYNLLDIDG